jgi:hypothetical protein
MFDCIPSMINKLEFRGDFGFKIRHNLSFKEGSWTVIGAKVVIHFVVQIGERRVYHSHEN